MENTYQPRPKTQQEIIEFHNKQLKEKEELAKREYLTALATNRRAYCEMLGVEVGVSTEPPGYLIGGVLFGIEGIHGGKLIYTDKAGKAWQVNSLSDIVAVFEKDKKAWR